MQGLHTVPRSMINLSDPYDPHTAFGQDVATFRQPDGSHRSQAATAGPDTISHGRLSRSTRSTRRVKSGFADRSASKCSIVTDNTSDALANGPGDAK